MTKPCYKKWALFALLDLSKMRKRIREKNLLDTEHLLFPAPS